MRDISDSILPQRHRGGIVARGFENACFISYTHSDPTQEVVEAFEKALAVQVALYLPRLRVFRDRGRLRVGDFFDPELAEQLCRSVCMVLLFNPCYFDRDHPYCAREYKAMEKLEAQRRGLLPDEHRTRGLILPVVMRADDDLPAEIRRSRLCASFSKRILRAADFEERECAAELERIAGAIYQRWKVLRQHEADLAAGCAGFEFPSEEEIRDWLAGVAVPQLPLPGR